ncbi:hypothetical protein VTN49DRAFT_7185 [Thermomyces lanuginosus]|uniref:uncharacterized protein n=1 Tax=Thermomyces lanuginosus TaxID=5541 RepID=UPI003743562A
MNKMTMMIMHHPFISTAYILFSSTGIFFSDTEHLIIGLLGTGRVWEAWFKSVYTLQFACIAKFYAFGVFWFLPFLLRFTEILHISTVHAYMGG